MLDIVPIHSKDNHTYWVDATDKLYIQRLRNGQYQGHNWQFAQTLIKQYRNAIDIGSNNACNAIHYAKRFNHVLCFEPTGVTQTLWKNTVRDNNVANATLYTTALAEKAYATEIVLFKHNLGHNHLENQYYWDPSRTRRRTRATQAVQCVTLDSYNFSDIDFIKIDVEGFELNVLKGAVNTISANRPVCQLEIVEHQCKLFYYTPQDLFDYFNNLNYVAVCRKRGIINEYSPLKGCMDYWFVPREHLCS